MNMRLGPFNQRRCENAVVGIRRGALRHHIILTSSRWQKFFNAKILTKARRIREERELLLVDRTYTESSELINYLGRFPRV